MSLATGSELSAENFSDFVQRLRHHVRGEGVSWHHTADAIFTVQARKIMFGIDPDYTDKLAVAIEDSMYFSPQEYWDANEDMRAQLDREAEDTGDGPFLEQNVSDQWDILGDLRDHTVSGWDERWDFINAHFTKEAAEAFIARKKHDYRDGLRVYVDAQVYCWEFNAIINGLLDGQIVFSPSQAASTEPVAWVTRGTKDGKRKLDMPDFTANPKYIVSHDNWDWEPLFTHPATQAAQPTEQDAARYRWLRESGEIVASSTKGRIAIPMYKPSEKHKAELDAAIDAAILASQAKKEGQDA